MENKGIITIVFVALIASAVTLLLAGIIFWGLLSVPPVVTPLLPRQTAACPKDTKLCADGSVVSRVMPACDFAPCPAPAQGLSCTRDSDCPSADYSCQAIEGTGTVSPGTSSSSQITILKGECKLKAGYQCRQTDDCLAGLVCHASICSNPQGASCKGQNDATCPSGYTCEQSCGPPLARQNEPPPPWFCELNEVAAKPRMCPICLAENTMIATPSGEVNVKDVTVGMDVWSLDIHGNAVASKVLQISRTPVPATHRVVRLQLSDGREVWVSPQHPSMNGGPVGELESGQSYDGALIQSARLVPYWADATYDLLPDSTTGEYFANGIPLKSTLK